MWPDRISNPGPLTSESGALLTAPHDPVVGMGVGEMCVFGGEGNEMQKYIFHRN